MKTSRNKESYLDPWFNEIKAKFEQHPTASKMALYQYFKAKDPQTFKSYSTFSHYTSEKQLQRGTPATPHVRYETAAGHQLQVDWKESMSVTCRSGEVLTFNLFAATLGYSRYHFFLYSRTRTTEEFLRCLIDVFHQLHGCVKEVLTDNMTAVVSIFNGTRKKHPIIQQFEKDSGIRIRLCQVRSPQTKGKVESSNRFVQWLDPYQGEIEDEAELLRLLEKLNHQINQQVNQTTGIPPAVLLKKEMEHLTPIPNALLWESYIQGSCVQTVPETLLVTYQGCGYSVAPQLIGKRVKVIPIDDQLYIYHNTHLEVIHAISRKKMNYQLDHYHSALQMRMKGTTEAIEQRAQANLALLEKLEER